MSTENENDLIAQRRQDLKELRKTGNAYTNQFKRDSLALDLYAQYKNKSKEELDEALIKKLLHKKTKMKITSGGNEPVIDKAISGHSLFAYAFLNILKDNEDFLRATDVYSEIERNLAVIKQEPEWSRMFGDLGGNYFFFVNNNLPEFK